MQWAMGNLESGTGMTRRVSACVRVTLAHQISA